MNQHPPAYILANGIIGTTTSFFAAVSPFQEQLEWHVRMGASMLGIAVALVTLHNLLKPKKP
jgi:hypothetical protein